EYRKWYKTARWLKLRDAQLAAEPLCRMCHASGDITPAIACDHIEPHRGNETKFWSGPFQSLCKTHHNATKQRDEARGYQTGCDASGMPLDERHHWMRT